MLTESEIQAAQESIAVARRVEQIWREFMAKLDEQQPDGNTAQITMDCSKRANVSASAALGSARVQTRQTRVQTRQTRSQCAVIQLRKTLGLTQQELAVQMGKAVVTIARWETSRPPTGVALVELEQVALNGGQRELATMFKSLAEEKRVRSALP